MNTYYASKKKITDKAVKDIKNFVRNPFTFPGAYETVAITGLGDIYCSDCVLKDYKDFLKDAKIGGCSAIQKIGIMWEGDHVCEGCGKDVTVYN